MPTFSHSGDFGDLIAHLTVIAQMGGGDLVLYASDRTGRRMTTERVACIKPFLEIQPYIQSVTWNDCAVGIDLDEFRSDWRHGMNLADMGCAHFGVPLWPRNVPWAVIRKKRRIARIVFCRSHRARSHTFPWKSIWEAYRREAVFVGLLEEYRDFCAEVGPTSYVSTPTILDVAEVLAGSELVVCNQSSPFWVAESLKLRLALEVSDSETSFWDRPNFYYREVALNL